MAREEKPAFLGIFTHTEPVFSLDDQILSAEQCFQSNRLIKGIQIRLPWRHAHPEKNTFHWGKVDRLINLAASYGKLVHFCLIPGFHTPDWVYEEGAAKAGPVTVGGTQSYTPILWDSVYMDAFSNVLRQFSEKYANDSRISAVHVMGHNYKGDEMHAPKDITALERNGFSKKTVLENWKYWIDLYGEMFPRQKLILVVSQMYPGFKDLPYEVAEYFTKKYQGRAVLQSDQLHGRQDALGQPSERIQLSDSIIRSLHPYAPHGHEMVGSFKEQPQRQGSAEMTIYNFVRMGNPLYLQLWRRDCDDSRFAEMLLKAWDTYGHLEPDSLKSRLQSEGLYVEKSDWNPEEFFKHYKRIDPVPPSKRK